MVTSPYLKKLCEEEYRKQVMKKLTSKDEVWSGEGDEGVVQDYSCKMECVGYNV